MKKYSPSLKKIASITGLFLGFFALSVWAADWTAAPCLAPHCNTDAPINVGSDNQNKLGGIAVATSTNKMNPDYSFESGGQGFIWSDLGVVGKTITGALMVKGTDSDKVGYILTNDGNGNAEWKSLTSASSGSGTVLTVDISTWKQAWYVADPINQLNHIVAMKKVDSSQLAYPTSVIYFEDGSISQSFIPAGGTVAVCPPKAIMTGSLHKDGNSFMIRCAAPTNADLPSSFMPNAGWL